MVTLSFHSTEFSFPIAFLPCIILLSISSLLFPSFVSVTPRYLNCTQSRMILEPIRIEYCEQYGFRIMNGFFQHRNVHTYTWTQTTRQLKSIIDYVIINQHTHFKPQDVRVYRGAECGSDHYLVTAKIYLPYRKMRNKGESENEQQITLEAPRYKVRSLQQDSIRFLYKMRVANKIATIEEDV